MNGIYMGSPWKIEVAHLPAPEPGPGEALIKVKSTGVCGSDIGAFRGANPLVTYPRVIGHEIAGEIVSIPDNEKGLKPGDHVIVDPFLYCGHCYPCSLGRTNCCTDLKVLGVHVDGGMVEYFAHPANMLVKAPDSIPWELVPLAEPLTIALHGLHRANLAAGEHIAISGAGPIGLLAAMSAIVYGAIPILIDPLAERLKKARELGIKHTVHLGSENALEKVAGITGGRLAEVVMEASGANPAIISALELVSNAGRVILTGWPKNDTPIPTGTITKKELNVCGARTSAGEFDEALRLIDTGKVHIQGILSKVVPADELPLTVRDMEANPDNYMKVVGVFS